MAKVPDLKNRKIIFLLIEKNPGINLSTIAEMLQMSIPLVDYHTHQMSDNGLVTIEKDEGKGYKRYYITGETTTKDKKILGILRQEIPLKIVMFLLEHPYSKHNKILENFEIAGSTLSYHINKLVKNGIVSFHGSGEKRGYYITDEKEVINFLTRYKPSKTLKRFKETWADDFHIP